MSRLIINADDFGKSKDVNLAIMKLMDQNLCSDTTMLVNFEDSEHAAKLAIENEKKNNVGIHLNLTEGIPLTSRIKNELRFCNEEGYFHYKKSKRIIFLSQSEKTAIYEELKSQIHLCRSLGIPISHADSHNHIHEEPGIFPLILKLLRSEKIPLLRLTNNIGLTTLFNKLYRNACNSIIFYNNMAATNYFGSISDFNHAKKNINQNSIIELMVHPGLITNNQIFDIYTNENLSLELANILNDHTLISYNQLL